MPPWYMRWLGFRTRQAELSLSFLVRLILLCGEEERELSSSRGKDWVYMVRQGIGKLLSGAQSSQPTGRASQRSWEWHRDGNGTRVLDG